MKNYFDTCSGSYHPSMDSTDNAPKQKNTILVDQAILVRIQNKNEILHKLQVIELQASALMHDYKVNC